MTPVLLKSTSSGNPASGAHGVTLADALPVWARVALLSFGGPAGQIAVMHRILVEERKWVSEGRFLHALNYCMLLPGPEAQQLATYIGWLMHGTAGGLVAGGLFVLPGAVAIMALSVIYALFGKVGVVAALFFGLKAAVLAVVVQAVLRIGSRALKSRFLRVISVAAFAAIFFFGAPFPLIILAAGCAGALGPQLGYGGALPGGSGHAGSGEATLLGETAPDHAGASPGRAARVAAIWLTLWLAPVAALALWLGPDDRFTRIGVFFSEMAVVTFGGAYAVLGYVAQEAVQTLHWLSPGEMLAGLGMAETTPGPLIMVLQFVGFMAAFRDPHGLAPVVAGALGGLLATWVTFTPCFLWIFLGAPYIERLRGNRALTGALSAITAAVVGVILNLALWFSIHVFFTTTTPVRAYGLAFDLPVFASLDGYALLLAAVAALALFWRGAGLPRTLALCAAAGLALQLLGLIDAAG